jgi:hypothetical protein
MFRLYEFMPTKRAVLRSRHPRTRPPRVHPLPPLPPRPIRTLKLGRLSDVMSPMLMMESRHSPSIQYSQPDMLQLHSETR